MNHPGDPRIQGIAVDMGADEAPAEGEALWTFMVYLDGDNDLEGAAIDDFLEMSRVGSSGQVNIAVLFDRISGYDSRYDNWTDARRGLVRPGDVPNASWGQCLGEANMGDPQTLQDFITWAITHYPANHYALVVWDHGSGWRGLQKGIYKDVCWDYTNNWDVLHMREVERALSGAETSFDVIGFDACLMGMVEVAYALRSYGSVMVGSEKTIPYLGWPYDTILTDLTGTPTMTSVQLGTVIVDRYYESYVNDQTLAAVDLTNTAALANEVNQLAQTTLACWQNDPVAVVSQAAVVQYTLDQVILHEHHGSSWPGAHGLAIYFPTNSLDPDYYAENVALAQDTQWDEFLAGYLASMQASWIENARDRSQTFDDLPHVDLYDYCQKLHDCFQYHPDMWVKQGANWVGDNVYNDDGTNQTGRRTVVAGTTAVFQARLYNDGTATETFWIKGPAGDANWIVKYFQGTTEVTAQVTSAKGWKRPNVPPGGMRTFTIQVTPQSGLPSGQSFEVLVRAESKRDPTQRDAIKVITRVK